jgi:peptidoglycan/LPS O-acetylase OafA/YrhL
MENMQTKPAAKPNYFPAIDGLRLLASVNIVMLHLAVPVH